MTDNLLLRQISQDRALASAVLFAHRHKQASPPFHVEIMDLWRSAEEFVWVEAFRQGAKTTLSEEFLTLEQLFGNFNYCLIFGETYTKACQRISSIKNELLTNQAIYSLFGKQKGPVWSENKIVIPNGSCIEAHGWEEEIRGFDHNGNRPDRAYLDDIENTERVRDTATVDINWKKLYKQLIPAMDKERRKVRMTGTPLAEDCMIRRAAASKHWVGGRFPIADKDPDDPTSVSAWPERYGMAWIREEKARYEREGMLGEFNQELMLIATGAQGKPFVEDMLRFEDIAPLRYSPRKVIIDPARTTTALSDLSGWVVVSRVGSKIYVHESGGASWQPSELVDAAFSLSVANDNAEVNIEKNSLEQWLSQPIRAKMLLTGQSITVNYLQAPQDRDKNQFIMGLQPFFEAGDVVLIGGRAKHPQLVSQLLNFPSGKKDVLNALAYATRVFGGVPVYGDFCQANIVDGYVPSRGATLLLGANATGSETTAVLVALDGQCLTVLADWISPLVPSDAIPDIAALIKAVYPGRRVTAWMPADVYDQVGRNPLVTALKLAGYRPARGEHSVMARSSLSPLLRTTMRGRRMLLVDNNARHVMQALASGYNWPVKPGGEREPNPAPSPARTLIEGLECLTFVLNRDDNDPKLMPNTHNSHGIPYMSALRHGR